MTNEEKETIGAALKGMFSFFTMLPINIEMVHINSMNKKFWLVPVVGLFYGLFAALVFCLCNEFVSHTIAAAVTILLVGIMNRFLHIDGTIDIGDGLTVAGKREDHVRALKDTLIGAGGMATGLLIVLMTFSEYLALTTTSFLFIGISAEIMARNAQVAAAAYGTPGNGMAGDSVRYTTKDSLLRSYILTIALLTVLIIVLSVLGNNGLRYIIPIIIGLFATFLWGVFMSKVAEKNFGMVNGDVLGATNETSRVIGLFVMIASISLMGL